MNIKGIQRKLGEGGT